MGLKCPCVLPASILPLGPKGLNKQKNIQKANLNQQLTIRTAYKCVHITAHINTAQNSSDNLPPYPPDNHHGSDTAYCRGEANITAQLCTKLML